MTNWYLTIQLTASKGDGILVDQWNMIMLSYDWLVEILYVDQLSG